MQRKITHKPIAFKICLQRAWHVFLETNVVVFIQTYAGGNLGMVRVC